MAGEMTCKGCGRKQLWHNIRPGGTEEKNENLSQDSQSPGQDLKAGPSEYE
jgi:hypothetical protein